MVRQRETALLLSKAAVAVAGDSFARSPQDLLHRATIIAID
ncbi:hypothetical protein HPTD01_2425 [Halomonas sp. TD01]|nr:hypothetical protein GME_02580 [Halomonas sp. TD01]CAH1043947.1 hypothetical protein HPTD01_2425 [Halomonas sp. TD01]